MAELAIGTTVGGAFLSASLQVLFDKLASPALREFGLLCGVGYELKRLRGTLLKIRYLVGDAEARHATGPHLTMWLRELKDAAYDVEDILDEFATEILRRKSQVSSSSFFLSSISPRQFLFDYNISDKINEIRGRLDDIARERDDLWLGELGDGPNRPESVKKWRESSSFPSEPDVFGRDEEREELVSLLLLDSDEEKQVVAPRPSSSDPGSSGAAVGDHNWNLPVLAIVGMGGVGKTTLAQLVYNDSRMDCYFQLKMWVWVSDDLDAKVIVRKIMESAGGGAYYYHGTENLDTLQKNLSEMLKGKRFLLVLDDVWSEDRVEWHKLRAPLIYGEKGSKVVVTTRSAKVAEIIQTMMAINLGGLSDEDCWLVFQKCAFDNGVSTENTSLEAIGFNIVQKLKGIPLAARTLGGILHSKFEEWRWKRVLESDIWELQQDDHDILPTLRLSYQHLPTHLKQCFAYCCVFPKGYIFDKAKLIQFWMALRFVHTQRGERMEDVGSDYFDELLSRSLFHRSGEDGYVMHDLLHDLAFSVSDDECFMVGDDETHMLLIEEEHNLRHLSFSCHVDFKNLYRFKSLRTLLNLKYSSQQDVPHDLFTNLRLLRILDLSLSLITRLPDSIGQLKHLRYLDVSYTDIEALPRTLSCLYNLQCLMLEGCHQLQELPKGVRNLTNLRHLRANASLLSKIDGIGRLTSLQELEVFSVSNWDGYRIDELKDMTCLRGKLCIRNIENVKSKEEAKQAVLNNKRHLDAIELEWVDNGHFDGRKARLEEQVLEVLQPPPNLKELTIKSNAGTMFPSWIGNQYLNNLESICLHQCQKWVSLPPLGQLPSLRSLQIRGMAAVKNVDHEFFSAMGFPSLQVLELDGMSEWKEWLRPEDGQVLFPCLRRLLIRNCPKLQCTSLPLPASLEYLCIEGCPGIITESLFIKLQVPTSLSIHFQKHYSDVSSCMQEALRHLRGVRCLQIHYHESSSTIPLSTTDQSPLSLRYDTCQETNGSCHSEVTLDIKWPSTAPNNDDDYISLSSCMQSHLASLTSLSICSCLKLASLLGGVLFHLSSLVELKIDRCEKLMSLELLQGASFLKVLKISCCPDLTSLPEGAFCHLSALERLKIVGCKELRSYDGLRCLVSLRSLEIFDCPKLTSLRGDVLHHLKVLEKLYIRGCQELATLGFQALVCLENMKIEKCPKLSSDTLISSPSGEGHAPSSSLKYLSIDHTSLLTTGPLNLSSLQELVIHDCLQSKFFREEEEPLLQSLTCLERFVIFKCNSLQQLPAELQILSSLRSLRIGYCPQLRSLPEKGLPPSLEHLYISGCQLLEERCRKKGCPDWPKIAQTTQVHMYGDGE